MIQEKIPRKLVITITNLPINNPQLSYIHIINPNLNNKFHQIYSKSMNTKLKQKSKKKHFSPNFFFRKADKHF